MSSKILTDVDIANMALGYLGEQKIASLAEATKEAKAISLYYSQTLDEIMESRRWSAGRKRARLTREEDHPAFGFVYSFLLPSDCLRVLDVVELPESGIVHRPPFIRNFEIEGRKLYTDYPHTGLVFVREVIASDLTPLMVRGFSLTLAAKIAPSLGESRLGPMLSDQAYNALKDAWISDVRQSRSMENSSFEQQSREWLGEIRGGSDNVDHGVILDPSTTPVPDLDKIFEDNL